MIITYHVLSFIKKKYLDKWYVTRNFKKVSLINKKNCPGFRSSFNQDGNNTISPQ